MKRTGPDELAASAKPFAKPVTPPRRQCFISYYHADQSEVDAFILDFDRDGHRFITREFGPEMPKDIIDSPNSSYAMSRIRHLYLKTSSVTIVMIGKCTWARRHVDWEIQASLWNAPNSKPNGLLAIRLPSCPDRARFPDRLKDNLILRPGQLNCYARWITYPANEEALQEAIEEAYECRETRTYLIQNWRARMEDNRPCFTSNRALGSP